MITIRRKKIYWLSCISAALVLIGLILIVRVSLLEGFLKAEKSRTENDVKRALAIVQLNAVEFSDRFSDWSSWDDAYHFVQDGNSVFVEANMNNESVHTMDLSLLAFFNAGGKLVKQTAFDPEGRPKPMHAETLKKYFSLDSLLLNHATLQTRHSGLLDLPEGPMIISSRPILNSKGEGPQMGTLVNGRHFNQRQIDRLSNLTELPLAVFQLNKTDLPADIRKASVLLKNSSVVVFPIDEQTIAGYAVLKDIYGKPCLLMRVQVPRNIYQHGKTSMLYFIASTVVLVLFSLVLVLWLIRKVGRSNDELRSTIRSLQETRDRLMQSEKLASLGTIVSGVAHELNNPLTSIIGFSDIVLSQTQGSFHDELREMLQIINKEGERCKKIVQDLLSFARRRQPKWEEVDIKALIDEAIAASSLVLGQKNVRIQKSYASEELHVEADPSQLKQVFLNLLKNAMQAMEKNAREKICTIEAISENGQQRITFADSGPGIRSENLQKIFEPFFTTKEVGSGTGLGLSLCYGIIKQHNGDISVASPAGRGAEFVIRLPRIGTQEAGELRRQPPPKTDLSIRRLSGLRVLVTEDEPLIRKFLETVLSAEGLRVETADNGETAYEKVTAGHYDLLICDYRLPKLDGMELYRRLIENNPSLKSKFLFITGQTGDEELLDFFLANDLPYIAKPFSKQDVLDMIEKKFQDQG